MSQYPVGEQVRLKCEFATNTGVLADPTVVQAQYADPNGMVTTVTPAKDGVGVYHYDLTLTLSGTWTYRFTGTGGLTAATFPTPITAVGQPFA